MTSCLVKPALYIVQRTGPRVKLAEPSNTEETCQESDTGRDLLKLSVFRLTLSSLSANLQESFPSYKEFTFENIQQER